MFTSSLRKNKQFIARFIMFFLGFNFFSTLITASVQEIEPTKIYAEIGKLYLPSLANQKLAEEEEAKKIKKENEQIVDQQSDNLDKIYKDIKVQKLGVAEKMNLLYSMLSLDKSNEQDLQNILHTNVFDDLEIFCGYKPNLEHHLFAQLDHTQTDLGGIALQKMIYNPTTNIEELEKRQRIVQELVTNENLFNTLDSKLKTLKKGEEGLIWLWKDLELEVKKYFEQAYFGQTISFLKQFNKNETLLETSALWTTVGKPTLAIASPILETLLMGLSTKLINNALIDLVKGPEEHKITYYEGLKRFFKMQFGLFEKNATLGLRALSGAILALQIYGMYESINSALQLATTFNNISNDIQNRMINVATFTNNMRDIALLSQENEVLAQDLELESIKVTFNYSHDYATADLLKALEKNTFKGEAEFFSHKGRALATFKKIQDVKNNVISSMKVIGQLDAYLSIAKLYKKFATNNNATFSFVNYVKQDSPYLNIVDGWHPTLNAKTVVTNSIELGQPEGAQNVILTGPNAGGKSTFLKMSTIAIILAQSFGIAPVKEMTLTPFSLINTYLNIADTEGKESLFQAEMNRTRDLLNTIRCLKKGEFSFVIMDEIFTGTNPKEGMAAAYGVAKKLSTFKNNIGIVATHFMVLTDLEEDTNGSYANYKVRVNKNVDGIEFLYKLEPGITDQAIALELLQEEGFDDDILQDAFNVLNNKQQARAHKTFNDSDRQEVVAVVARE